MNLLKKFSTYTISNFFGAGIGFFVMPILTHYLTPSDYGILSLFNTYVTIIVPIISLNANGFFSVEFYKKKSEKNYLKSVFSNVLIIPIILLILLTLVLLPSSNLLEKITEIPAHFILLIPILAFLTILYETLNSLLVIKKKATHYAFLNIGKVIIETSLTILLIIVLKYHWEGRIYSWLITILFIAFIAFIYFKNSNLITYKIDKGIIKKAVLYGSPLIAHSIGKLIINQSDRIFISKMVSVDEAGIYNTGYMIGSIILIIVSAFGNIYNPFLYERLAKITLSKKNEIIKLSYSYFFALFFLLISISLITPFFYKNFIDNDFEGGVKYVFWTSLAYVFWGIYIVFAGFLFYLKKTYIFAWLSVINVVLNLILNYLLIKQFGAIGASYATCISFFIVMIVCINFSCRLYPMPWLNYKIDKPL